MESFLTPESQATFATISLDYTYKYELHFLDRVKRHISSTSDRGHYEILLDLMNHDLVPYDSIAYDHLINFDMYKGVSRLAELGDMVFHNIKSKKTLYASILYCPSSLTEYQQLRLRLWYEYFRSINSSFEISYQTSNGILEIENDEINPFLESQGIFDDNHIYTLTKKYPD